MNLNFTKMQGCGNDYIYINCFEQHILNPEKLSILLSNRHFGIGADGIILVCPSDIADAKMRMFNSDGTEGKMCGNGIRCVCKFLYDYGLVQQYRDEITIETLAGVKKLKPYKKNGEVYKVKVNMGKVFFSPDKIPVKLSAPLDKIIAVKSTIANKEYKINCLSMGNPHCVIFMEYLDNLDIQKIGPLFENHSMFPEGVNTEFVEIIDQQNIKMRVWERGSNETLACGTGACAAAIASVENGFCKKNSDIQVYLKGGTLTVNYTNESIYMTGDAKKVFEGVITI